MQNCTILKFVSSESVATSEGITDSPRFQGQHWCQVPGGAHRPQRPRTAPPSPPLPTSAAHRTRSSISGQAWAFSPSPGCAVGVPAPSSVWAPQPHATALPPVAVAAAIAGPAQRKAGLLPSPRPGLLQGAGSA